MLTKEQREKIINMNFEYIRPYIKQVMEEFPALENSVHIEGIAECLYESEAYAKKKPSFDSAIRSYKNMYDLDDDEVKKIYDCRRKPRKDEYSINEDLTQAVMENVKDKIDFAKKVEEHNGDAVAALLDDFDEDDDRFYGTVVNEQTLKKLNKANMKLDVISTLDRVTVQRFKEAEPRSSAGIVAINLPDFGTFLSGVHLKAFRELSNSADNIDIIPSGGKVRIAFVFDNLWKESRELTDAELRELEDDELTDEDLEEIEKDIERFNKGEFDHD